MKNISLIKFIRTVAIGALTGSFVTAVLLVLTAAVLAGIGVLPEEYLHIAVLAALALGGFSGGYLSARILKSNGLLSGLLTGLVIFAVLAAVGIFTSVEGFTAFTLYKAACLAIAGMLGGILGVNKKEKIKIR